MGPKRKPFHQLLHRVRAPVEHFLQFEASSGLLLLAVTAVALLWANSPWQESYENLLHWPFFNSTLHHWINDGLMVIFFFVVGLEIKRELTLGELSDRRRAALPMVAALGGMIVPALFYSLLNWQGVGRAGWGIPMATDIAFAVGVLTLFGRKVPLALKVFLLALAIVDDLGAVLVIALFYTQKISLLSLGLAVFGLCLIVLLRRMNVRHFWVYWIMGILIWYQVLQSGVHATVAGVILGLMTPVHPLPGQTKSPLDQLIHQLHGLVSFLIMPIFALANAGVHLGSSPQASAEMAPPLLSHPITQGVILGLLLGKPIGVVLFSWLAIKMNWATMPRGVSWRHMLAAGSLAGIGFTMALFISNLALKTPELEHYSKSGILIASALAAGLGILMLLLLPAGKNQNLRLDL
ncbi:MAG: Na+/H+ antiporter NhaA [Bdellovibrionales bacterium]